MDSISAEDVADVLTDVLDDRVVVALESIADSLKELIQLAKDSAA